jgi:hypothetical protein
MASASAWRSSGRWTGFHALSRDEIVAIVENLLVGKGSSRLRICEACEADLTAIRNPLVIFSSEGDNITRPLRPWLGSPLFIARRRPSRRQDSASST